MASEPAARPGRRFLSFPAIRGVVFDLDGTLVDSYAAIAESLNHARAGVGLPALDPLQVRTRVGWGLEHLIEDLVGPQHVAEGVRRFRERYAEVYPRLTTELPGARRTLRALRQRGLRLAVASNKPALFSGPILADLGMLDEFCCVMGPDLAGAAKPDPAMIHRCLEAMETSAAQSLYVGDMALDVESGRRAGVDVVLVTGGSSGSAELEASGRPVLASLDDLPGLLAQD